MPDEQLEHWLVIAIPSGVALAIVTAVGVWLRSRSGKEKKSANSDNRT